MAVWPAGLPQGMFIGLQDARVSSLVRSPTDAGIPKVRRRFTATLRVLSVPIVLTTSERTTFDTFYISTLAEGSLPFDWTDPIDGSTVEYRFREPAEFRTISTNLWSAVLSLEMLP